MSVEGLIVNEGEKYYSSFKKVFQNIDELCEKYNWLISYPECYPQAEELKRVFAQEYVWLTGEALKQALQEDFQWIWGIFSGFRKENTLEEVLKYELPYADGNEGIWKEKITIQHKLAEIEFVAWDSSCTLYISKNKNILKRIKGIYPKAKDLTAYNKLHTSCSKNS